MARRSLQDGHLLASKSQKFAFRRAVIVQDELVGQEGRSFLFEINNIRIFCGGACHMVGCLKHEALTMTLVQDRIGFLPIHS